MSNINAFSPILNVYSPVKSQQQNYWNETDIYIKSLIKKLEQKSTNIL